MKEVPIIFNGEMVRAILADLKNQTRRPRKTDKPPCQIGDLLWVRETWRPKSHNFPIGWEYEYRATAESDLTPTDGLWRPSQKPTDLFRYLIRTYSNPGDVVFDGYGGSGTTAIAAQMEGRKFIVCENHLP